MKRKLSMLLTGALLLLSVLLMIVGCGGSGIELTFEPNGGTMEQTAYEVEGGEAFTMPIPVREGYSFEGWYTDSALSGEAAPAAVTPDRDTAYYAKWEKLYAVNFDLGEGTLPGGTVYLKAGANIKEAVKDLVPQYADHQLGEWLLNGSPLLDSEVMPSSDITLKAHYKVMCTVEVFLEKLDGGYEKGETAYEYAYEGVDYVPTHTENGFALSASAHDDEVKSKKVSAAASENLFRLYFDRSRYTVMFLADYPFETENRGDNRSFQYPYETELEAPKYFNAEAEGRGYVFLGWAVSHGGDVVYHVDSIGGSLYGGSGEAAEGDPITVERDLTLYGVWAKGYIDLFRGGDYIYRFPDSPEKVYLQREKFFFEGEYAEAVNEFYFFDAQNDIILQGSFVDDGVFAYSSSDRADRVHSFYNAESTGSPVDTSKRLFFDEYNGVEYRDEQNDLTCKGTYTLDDAGCLVVTYTSGGMSGETHIYRIATYTDSEGAHSVYMERNEEEYGYGALSYSFVSSDGMVYTYRAPIMNLIMDGFGTCALIDTSGSVNYFYYQKSTATSKNGEPVYNILNSDRTPYVSVCIGEEGGVYWLYDATQVREYYVNSSLKKILSLDGTRNATYTDEDGTVYEGVYATATSYLKAAESEGSELLYLFAQAPQQKTFIFRIDPFELDGMGVLTYSATLVPESYGEFLYSDEKSAYYTPFFVFDADGENSLSLYGYTKEGRHVLVSKGTYTFDENTLLYHYTAKDYVTSSHYEVLTTPIDPSQIASCYFCVGMKATSSGYIPVTYWYTATMQDGTTETYQTTYTSGEETLVLLKGVAILKLKEGVISGTYREANGYTAISTAVGTVYVELNEEDKSFTLIEGFVGTYSALAYNGSGADDDTLTFTGKDNKATYTVPPAEKDGAPVVHEGTYQGTNEMVPINADQSAEVYEFVSDDNTIVFQFLLLSTSNGNSYFARFSETYHGEYTEEGGGKLTLDGYGLHAVYEVDGDSLEAWRYTVAGNTVTISIEEGLIVFDLGEDDTFTTRGGEAGGYVVVDNQETKNLYYDLDGYGNLVVYAAADPTDANSDIVYIDEHGTYERDGYTYIFHYNDNGVPMNVTAASGVITENGRNYACMIVEHPETVRSYVNENDLSVLVLDGYGTAVKYGANGSIERGYYILVTETMLYYTNGDVDDYDGCIFVYDTEKGTATEVRFRNLGYYTESLESILFSADGMMLYNQTAYYYNVDAQNVATIYRKYDAALDGDKTPNKYGFVSEEFGELKKNGSVVYGGKTYYPTSGYAITFDRVETDKDKYPIPVSGANFEVEHRNLTQLTFAPTGSGTFGVRGTLIIGDGEEKMTISNGVYVYRTVAEDGSASLYFTVQGSRSIFRFEIEVSYMGDSIEDVNRNTFTVKSMRTELVMRSETYMTLYYLFMLYIGMVPEDTYGTITIVEEYGEDGEPLEDGKYVNGAFGISSGLYDINGEIVTFEKLPFTQDEQNSSLYTVEIPGNGEKDQNNYRLRFLLTTGFTSLGSYTYRIAAFTRCQELTSEDGNYTLTVERIIRSDYYTAGIPYMPVLKDKEGNTIEIDAQDAWRVGSSRLCLIKRVKSEDGTKNLSATYYSITLTEAGDGTVEEGERVPGYPLFEGFTITVKEATTHYTADGGFVDICEENHEVLMIYLPAEEEDGDPTVYLPDSTLYEEATKTYKAKISETLEYDVTIGDDGTATLKSVELTPEPAPEESEETDS